MSKTTQMEMLQRALDLEEYLCQTEKSLKAWTARREAEAAERQEELRRVRDALREHYEAIQIIPSRYRSLQGVETLLGVMSSAECGLEEAIERCDGEKAQSTSEEMYFPGNS